MNTLQERFDTLVAEQQKLKIKFQEDAQALFKEITKEFFDKNPGITGVVWTQYTPYFNDGDTCEFRVNDPSFTNANEDELDNVRWGEYDGEDESVWAVEGNISYVLENDRDYWKETKEKILASGGVDVVSCDLFSKTICSSEMEDVMEAMFGDHVRVVATREGFDVQDYDHD